MKISYKELCEYMHQDMLRQVHMFDQKSFICKIGVIIYVFISNTTFRFIVFYRLSSFLYHKRGLYKIFYIITNVIRQHYSYKLGISLYPMASIKGGLYFPHYTSIIVGSHAVYGKNLTVYQQATIGAVLAGKNKGAPIIGDNVIVSAGAKVLGNIRIGNNVMIGAGAIVVNDVPDNAVVVGNPARIISFEGYQHSKCLLGNLID